MTDQYSSQRPCRILAIDGGGIRGVYTAHILSRIEEELSIRWTECFDLMAGTSTGAIIAAALACELPASRILEMYRNRSSAIFRRRPLRRLGILASRYRNAALLSELNNLFGDTRLGDLSIRLIIPTTDIGNGCVHVLKSAYDPGFVRDRTVFVRDAVLASCSAPTYFDPHRVEEYALADGGLWANNPALVAAIEAKRRMGAPLDRLRILSLGTGTRKQFYPLKETPWTRLLGWGFATRWQRNRFVNMLLNLQAETVTNMLGLLLDRTQMLRLSFESDHVLPLDDVRDIPDLVAKADHDFTHNADKIKAFFAEGREGSTC